MSSIRSAAFLSASLVLAALPSAHAQQPAPTPPTTAVTVPPMTCESPGAAPIGPPGPSFTRFQKRVDDYKVCVNQYAAAAGAKSNEFADQARAYADAANKAIDSYNAYVTALNESTKSTKSGAEKN